MLAVYHLGMSGQDSLGGPTNLESQDLTLYIPSPNCIHIYTVVWHGLSSISHVISPLFVECALSADIRIT